MSQGMFESLPGTSDLELSEIDSIWDEFQERLEQKEISLDAQKASLRGELKQVGGCWRHRLERCKKGMDESNRINLKECIPAQSTCLYICV